MLSSPHESSSTSDVKTERPLISANTEINDNRIITNYQFCYEIIIIVVVIIINIKFVKWFCLLENFLRSSAMEC